MILTTTPSIEGKMIAEYLGAVTGKGIDAKTALDKMTQEAGNFGADAVIGIQISAGGRIAPSDHRVHTIGTAIKFQ